MGTGASLTVLGGLTHQGAYIIGDSSELYLQHATCSGSAGYTKDVPLMRVTSKKPGLAQEARMSMEI